MSDTIFIVNSGGWAMPIQAPLRKPVPMPVAIEEVDCHAWFFPKQKPVAECYTCFLLKDGKLPHLTCNCAMQKHEGV